MENREDLVRTKLRALKQEIEALSEMAADNRKPIELDQQSVGRLSRMDSPAGSSHGFCTGTGTATANCQNQCGFGTAG